MQIQIVLIGGSQDGAAQALDGLPVVVGRDETCGLWIEDRWASRRHCELFEQDGNLMIRDLASRHGTLIDGRPVEESKLNAGDRVMIGLTELLVSQVTSAEAAVEISSDEGSVATA